MLADGSVLRPLDLPGVERAVETLRAHDVQAVAVCFLHAYGNAAHEQAVADLLRARWPECHVAVSSELLPEFREYERLCSTVINAYLMPATRDYFHRFAASVASLGIEAAPWVVNSGGGVIAPEVAAQRPIDTLLSGPSAGVGGAIDVARGAGHGDILTFDMGGTSTDVSVVCGGEPRLTHARTIDGLPMKGTAIDVHTVGAGGSSVALVDAGGMLRVGPHSAGSDPGPACYGRGGERPTVTDANVVLGRLNPHHLLGGALPIDAARSHQVIATHVAGPKGIDVVTAAASIVGIAESNMAQAVRFVSVERGLDPRDFVLVAFGGAGPLHASAVGAELGVAGVLVPYAPGVLCAMGVLTNDVRMDFSRSHLVEETSSDCRAIVTGVFDALERSARAAFPRDDAAASIEIERSADVRYAGQNHELDVAVPGGAFDATALATVKERFHRAHEALYGYRAPERAIELVTHRVRARRPIRRRAPDLGAGVARRGPLACAARRDVFFEQLGGFVDCPIYDRASLVPDDTLPGPAIVEQMDTTTVIPPGFAGRVDAARNILIAIEER